MRVRCRCMTVGDNDSEFVLLSVGVRKWSAGGVLVKPSGPSVLRQDGLALRPVSLVRSGPPRL